MRLLLFLLAFLLNSWSSGYATSRRPLAPPAAGVSFLALGDSYTIGEGVRPAACWPVQLAALARQQGLALQSPDIIARTGWTTAELQEAIREAHNQQTYGLVTLQIGVNNEYRGQSAAQYRVEFRELLRSAVGFAGGQARRVVVLSIPDWGQSPAGQRQDRSLARISAEIDQFNAVAQDECQQAGIAYVDITPLTRAASGDAHQFAHDGLHYSGLHMQQWAQQALPVVRGLLLAH
jgi:lysophospholipase L1-like esterase